MSPINRFINLDSNPQCLDCLPNAPNDCHPSVRWCRQGPRQQFVSTIVILLPQNTLLTYLLLICPEKTQLLHFGSTPNRNCPNHNRIQLFKMIESNPVFKLRNLPFLALRKVFENLGPVELLQFSMVSAAYRRMIISLRCHCLNNGYIGINHSSRMCHFEIWPTRGGPFCDFGHLKFREFEDRKLKKYETRSSFTLNGVKVILIFSSKNTDGTLYIPNKTDQVLSVMEYFVETFGCVYYKIDVNLAYGNYWECGPLVEAVEFKTMSFHDCGPVSLRRPSNEELYKVLKNLKVSKKLEFEYIPKESGFKFLPLFQSEIEKIVLYGDGFVTGEMMLSMKAHEIDICECLVTTEDIMVFITRWFNSKDRKFKKLELSGKAIGPLDLTAFNATKFEPKKREMVEEEDWNTMEWEVGYDIKRADGLVGSVFQEETRFEFLVWHKKFIDKKFTDRKRF